MVSGLFALDAALYDYLSYLFFSEYSFPQIPRFPALSNAQPGLCHINQSWEWLVILADALLICIHLPPLPRGFMLLIGQKIDRATSHHKQQ